MEFLHVIEQNDICNMFLKKMDIAKRKFSYNRNSGILLVSKNHLYKHVQFLKINLALSHNTIAK